LEQIGEGHADDLVGEGLLAADEVAVLATHHRQEASLADVPRDPPPAHVVDVTPASQPPPRLERRPSSAAKKVSFDLPPEPEEAKAPVAEKAPATVRPIKDAVVEKPPTPAHPPSAKALGKRPATAETPIAHAKKPSLADKVLIKEVVERIPASMSDSGTNDEDDEDEDEDETSDEGSTFDYSDDDDDDFAERMDELMIQREAALAYHLHRSEQSNSLAGVVHDDALADNEVRRLRLHLCTAST
jgi:hypothetical protein